MNLFLFAKNMIKTLGYYIYLKRLEGKVHEWKKPYHIGIILDGNRRYAREKGYSDVTVGHEMGAEKLEEVLRWCEILGVKIISIWVFSLDNFNRDKKEVTSILGLIERKMRELAKNDSIHSNGIQIRSMGQLELLPQSLQDAIGKAEKALPGLGCSREWITLIEHHEELRGCCLVYWEYQSGNIDLGGSGKLVCLFRRWWKTVAQRTKYRS